jgi:hypothetical protein
LTIPVDYILAALLIASEVRYFLCERRHAFERNDLLSRVQAGTLRDYASNKQILDPPPAKQIEAQAGPSLEEMTSLGADAVIPEYAIAEAQSSYRSVMAGETHAD